MVPIPSFPARRRRLSARAGSVQKRVFNGLASRRSRKLGTAFRSPVTTLSHHYEVNAPALLLRFHAAVFANPFDPRLLRSVRFRSRNRANSSPQTRCPRRSAALLWCRPISTPLQVVSTLRIEAFNRPHHNKLASPAVRLFFAPRGALFRFRPGSTL